MIPGFQINKTADRPVYLQIAEKISELIADGVLEDGERLFPERDLALGLGVARGTVQKAYEELVRRGVAVPVQGRGTFVRTGEAAGDRGRLEKAAGLIDSLLADLEELRFSPREVRDLVHLKISERQEKKRGIRIALVDSSPEVLEMFRRQVALLARMEVKKIPLRELPNKPAAERKLGDFSLILCAAPYYETLAIRAPSLKKRIIRVAVSPSQETVRDMAGIGAAGKIGILCGSSQFLKTIRRQLPEYGISPGDAEGHLLSDPGELEAFIGDKRVLILPAGSFFYFNRENRDSLRRFTEGGGRLVLFDYRLERGSLLHLEEKIAELMGGEAGE